MIRPVFVLLLLVTHCYFLNQYPHFINPNITSRVYTTLAIIDDGTFSIDGPLERYRKTQDTASYRGRSYSDKPPGYAVALTPLAWILRKTAIPQQDFRALITALRLLGLSLPMVLFWFGVLPYFCRLTGREGLAAAVLLSGALGTGFFIYATRLFSASAAGALLFVSFLSIRRAGKQEWGREAALTALGAGLLAGAAFTFDFVVMLAVAVLFVHAMLSGGKTVRVGVLFGLGVSLVLAAWMAHNYLCFDHPLRVGFHLHTDPRYGKLYREGFLGVQPPSLEAFVHLSFSPARGIFFLSPALLLAFWGWGRLYKNPEWRADALVSSLVFATVFLFTSTTVEWMGGWSIGARYLVPSFPFLLIGVAGALRERPPGDPVFTVFAVLTGVGVLGVSLAAMTFSAFPHVFRNPLYHFALPLALSGVFTRSLFFPAHPAGLAATGYLFMALLVVVCVALQVHQDSPRKYVLVTAVIPLSLIIMFALSRIAEPQDNELERRWQTAEIVFRMGYDEEYARRSRALQPLIEQELLRRRRAADPGP